MEMEQNEPAQTAKSSRLKGMAMTSILTNPSTNGKVGSILGRLRNVKPSGNGWTACCPAHDDNRSSLSIGEGKDGKILLKCHAGCSTEAVVQALGLRMADLFPTVNGSANGKPRIVATYDYVDEAGKLLFQVVRHEPKDFRQRRPDDRGGFIWNMQGVRRVLYRLPEVIQAVKDGKRIWLVEGERDVDSLAEQGLAATTSVGGAGKWRDEYGQVLRGARVAIIPDADEPGRKHAQQ